MSVPFEHGDYLGTNQRAWDSLARKGAPLCQPANDKELSDPLKQVDPLGWLGESIHGWKVLCLAAGGGRHSALYAAAGADVSMGMGLLEGVCGTDGTASCSAAAPGSAVMRSYPPAAGKRNTSSRNQRMAIPAARVAPI